MKKQICFVFILVLIFNFCLSQVCSSEAAPCKSITASSSDESGTYGNLKYVKDSNRITITGYITTPADKLVIPEKIDDCPVTGIGDKAFYDCSLLTDVYMPSVKYIGYSAFYKCTSLRKAEIPNVEDIRFSAFSYCRSLDSFVISSNNKRYSAVGGILYNKDKTHIAAYPSASGAIETASGVQIIDGYAFEGCTLKKVNMPGVHTVKGCAFTDCILLENTYMPEVQYLEYSAFRGCTVLKDVTVPKLCSAAGNSFIGTEWYDTLSEEFATAGKGVLIKYNGKSENVSVPSDIKCVAGFFSNKNIKSVGIPSSAFVADSAFTSCSNLKSVDLSGTEVIESYAFSNCTSLDVTEFSRIRSIGDYAFYNCSSLKAARFNCNAPADFGKSVFDGAADGFTIYYSKYTSGWTEGTWNGYPAEAFAPSVGWGDLNGDNKINTSDAVAILKSAAGILNLTNEQKKAGDCNKDGKVNTADAVLILKYAAGIISGF